MSCLRRVDWEDFWVSTCMKLCKKTPRLMLFFKASGIISVFSLNVSLCGDWSHRGQDLGGFCYVPAELSN